MLVSNQSSQTLRQYSGKIEKKFYYCIGTFFKSPEGKDEPIFFKINFLLEIEN